MNNSPEKQDLDKYRLLSRSDLKGEFAFPGPATPEGVYLSSIVLVMHCTVGLPTMVRAEPVSPETNYRPAADDFVERVKRQVRELMRVLLDRLRGHGVDCPAVTLLSPKSESALLGSGAADTFRRSYASLAFDQDWHRGEFAVFIEESSKEAEGRLADLLAPQPPKVTIPRSAQNLQDVVDSIRQFPDANPVLIKLSDAWDEALAGSDASAPEPDRERSRRGEQAIDAYTDQALSPILNLLAEVEVGN